MGASSSVLSDNRTNDDSFQGVMPSSRSQRQRVIENTSLRRNISHQVNTLLVHGVQQHLNQQSLATPPSSGSTAVITAPEERSDDCKVEKFMDSLYISNWMSKSDADALYDCLAEIGEKHRPKDITIANLQRSKYPLWTKYYGLRRQRDGARALDRWGSYHESWIRVEEPPALLAEIAAKLRSHFHLQDEAVNSMVVNYYYDGDNTYIPAHRDTVACLEDESHVICLSLGASRDFVLCANEDAGKFDKEDMDIVREWRVRHGDIFAIGKETNQAYCHAVTREPGLSKMRISVVFRSIDKSFITYDCEEKIATYKSGKTKAFKAECISTKDYQDEGIREHIADLINARELAKRSVKLPEKPAVPEEKADEKRLDEDEDYRKRYEEELFAQNLKKELFEEGSVVPAPASSAILASYYLGQGVAVPTTLSGKVKPSA